MRVLHGTGKLHGEKLRAIGIVVCATIHIIVLHNTFYALDF